MLWVVFSCSLLETKDLGTPVARVGETVLYQSDLQKVINNSPGQDSTAIANRYINNWGRNVLYLQGASRNLNIEDQERFETLVQNYRTDLFVSSYKEALLSSRLDSTVTATETQDYYNRNNSTFILRNPLYRYRYINIAKDNIDKRKYKNALRKFDPDDQNYLDSLSLQFNSYQFNDSLWVTKENIIAQIPSLSQKENEAMLKKSNFFELPDSLGVYLVAIKEVRLQNEVAPLSFVKPTIENIILNQRKLRLSKQLDKEIVEDAFKDKKFEIY